MQANHRNFNPLFSLYIYIFKHNLIFNFNNVSYPVKEGNFLLFFYITNMIDIFLCRYSVIEFHKSDEIFISRNKIMYYMREWVNEGGKKSSEDTDRY